ncbi:MULTISPECIES: hypothetical protein [unclassified Streptomyces]|uniref:hypothetical protein n=1 Tax=unclassified Streptomyces TaxID=2593676 RepID=UPI0036E80B69
MVDLVVDKTGEASLVRGGHRLTGQCGGLDSDLQGPWDYPLGEGVDLPEEPCETGSVSA